MSCCILKCEVGSRKSEVGSRKSEVGTQKSEVGSRKSELRSRKSEVGSRKSELRSRKSEVGSRKSEVGSGPSRPPYFFLLLRVSYLVAQWLRAATERAQITVRQPKKEEAVIKLPLLEQPKDTFRNHS